MILALLPLLLSASQDSSRLRDSLPPAKPAVVSAVAVPSESPSSFERYGRWQFGFSGAKYTGGGLAVRRWFDDKNGIEVHGYAFLSKKHYPDDKDSWGTHYSSDGHYYGSDTGTVAEGELQLGVQYLREVARSRLFDGTGFLRLPGNLRGLGFVGIGAYSQFLDRSLKSTRSEQRKDSSSPYSYYTYVQVPYDIETHTTTQELQAECGGGAELEFGRLSVHLMVGMGGLYRFEPSEYEVGPTVDGGIFLRF